MFDNEIDWVTGLESRRIRREVHSTVCKFPDTFTYKAEHKPKPQQVRGGSKCSEL